MSDKFSGALLGALSNAIGPHNAIELEARCSSNPTQPAIDHTSHIESLQQQIHTLNDQIGHSHSIIESFSARIAALEEAAKSQPAKPSAPPPPGK